MDGIGKFIIKTHYGYVECLLRDNGTWSCLDTVTEDYLNTVFNKRDYGSPGYGAFMREAFHAAMHQLKGQLLYLRPATESAPGAIL